MSISATPGSTVAATLTLPSSATATVNWTVRDPSGNIVADGAQPATGTLVAVSFVMPSSAMVPTDGSSYSIVATDGTTSTRDSITVVSSLDPSYYHADEIAYMAGTPFIVNLVTGNPISSGTVSISLHDGTAVVPTTSISTSSPIRLGDSYAYSMNFGVVATNTNTSYGMGSIIWDYTDSAGNRDQAVHAFWTVTSYSSTFLTAIRKIVDRARVGDVNRYLNITTADLANALIRGLDYVAMSPPMLTPFFLDGAPIMLRDYIIKAAAADLLRAQYLAEGMSAFDMQGLGVQLSVDRAQYLDSLAQQLSGDLQGLPQAKLAWQQVGSPMGGQIIPTVRPVGILSLTSGVYNNFAVTPVQPLMAAGAYSFLRYGMIGGYI